MPRTSTKKPVRRTGSASAKTRAAAPRVAPEFHGSAGIAYFGEQVVVHGKDLHHECLDLSFVHYFLFCATGRWFDEVRARVWERLWISTGYPDPRLWCNRIAGYLGSARVDPGLAMAAAMAASNSTTYGLRALRAAYLVQADIPKAPAERDGWIVKQLATRRILAGYGRPVGGQDERIAAALKVLVDAGLHAGPALKRSFWLHHELGRRKGIHLNIAGAWGAIAIDFGLSIREYEAFMLLMLTPGHAGVYADQRSRRPFGFLPGYQTRCVYERKRD